MTEFMPKNEEETREFIDRFQKGARNFRSNKESGEVIESLTKERPVSPEKLSEGPEDILKLDKFLLNVPENQLRNETMVKEFMLNTLEKENLLAEEQIDRVRKEGDEKLLRTLIVSKFFIKATKSSLEEGNYKNKGGPIVAWFNAKREFYKKKMEEGPEESKPVYKEVIKRIETLGQTLILE